MFGDIDGYSDQMRAGFAGLARQLAARPQPNPVAMGVTHAEGAIDRHGLTVGELGPELVQLDVIGMNEGTDIAESEEIVSRLEAENGEHRVRPEDAAASDIPVP